MGGGTSVASQHLTRFQAKPHISSLCEELTYFFWSTVWDEDGVLEIPTHS